MNFKAQMESNGLDDLVISSYIYNNYIIQLYQVISTMELYQVMNPPSSIIQRR